MSAGQRRRLSLARLLAAPRPIWLLDEPTSALDADNRARVVELIREARDGGTAMLGILHDQPVRDAVASRRFAMPLAQKLGNAA